MEKFSKNVTKTTKLLWDAHIDIMEEKGWWADWFNVYFDSKIIWNFSTLQEAETYALTLVVKQEVIEIKEINWEFVAFVNWEEIEDSNQAYHIAHNVWAIGSDWEIKIWIYKK